MEVRILLLVCLATLSLGEVINDKTKKIAPQGQSSVLGRNKIQPRIQNPPNLVIRGRIGPRKETTTKIKPITNLKPKNGADNLPKNTKFPFPPSRRLPSIRRPIVHNIKIIGSPGINVPRKISKPILGIYVEKGQAENKENKIRPVEVTSSSLQHNHKKDTHSTTSDFNTAKTNKQEHNTTKSESSPINKNTNFDNHLAKSDSESPNQPPTVISEENDILRNVIKLLPDLIKSLTSDKLPKDTKQSQLENNNNGLDLANVTRIGPMSNIQNGTIKSIQIVHKNYTEVTERTHDSENINFELKSMFNNNKWPQLHQQSQIDNSGQEIGLNTVQSQMIDVPVSNTASFYSHGAPSDVYNDPTLNIQFCPTETLKPSKDHYDLGMPITVNDHRFLPHVQVMQNYPNYNIGNQVRCESSDGKYKSYGTYVNGHLVQNDDNTGEYKINDNGSFKADSVECNGKNITWKMWTNSEFIIKTAKNDQPEANSNGKSELPVKQSYPSRSDGSNNYQMQLQPMYNRNTGNCYEPSQNYYCPNKPIMQYQSQHQPLYYNYFYHHPF